MTGPIAGDKLIDVTKPLQILIMRHEGARLALGGDGNLRMRGKDLKDEQTVPVHFSANVRPETVSAVFPANLQANIALDEPGNVHVAALAVQRGAEVLVLPPQKVPWGSRVCVPHASSLLGHFLAGMEWRASTCIHTRKISFETKLSPLGERGVTVQINNEQLRM